ncbi:PREDICTED: collagen alpha-4(VI) chain-like [Acropora digitifera]|uniref:collagen alpha-4(VI) chain-like n=1 Tax=Acropora digitifera TaxID=70779 RepID=UPI00077B1336|nr:PREDICTED: collagen alpha-4(VI) chain-like [Acropora digitifera]
MAEPKPANINADIVFLIDSSTSVGRDGFDKEKDFIKAMAKYMKVSPDNTRASVITYSSNVRNVLNFTDHQTEMSFNQKIDREQWTGGTRRIDLALDAAVTSMSQARLNVQKIVILVTGGRQSGGAGDILERHAQRLNNMGAKILIVIVGSEANDRDFIPLVHSTKDIFRSSLFSDLRFEVQPIIKHIVQNFEVTPIKDEYIVFLLDSSSPVKPEQFQKEKEFIKSLAKRLYVGIVEKTFAAVVNYGSFPLTSIDFDDYSSFQEFEKSVDGITPADGTRRIDRALDEAASIFNSTDPYSSKILFLLTTGRQAQESDVTPFDVAIQPLIDMGTHTYVIAVGSAPSVRELRPLVDNPEDLFQLLFNMLQNQVPRIVKHTRTDHPRPIPDHHFVLLVDSSSNVTNQEFSQEILFVKALARELNVSIPNFHAAVISYGDRNSVVVRFGSYRSFRDFYAAVDSSAYQGGARRMEKALDSAHEILSAPNVGSQKTVVLITGGRNSENAAPKSLQLSAQKLQNIGANVLFVVFRSRYDVQELLPAVQHPNDIHQIQGAIDLLNYVSSLASYISLDRQGELRCFSPYLQRVHVLRQLRY